MDEWHIYGSARLGVYEANRTISKRIARDLNNDNQITNNEYVIDTPEEVMYLYSGYQLERGAKRYELTNHLGNVLTVISDKKTANFTGTTFTHFTVECISATDYSPFGAPVAGRTWNGGEYRFGFNTQERDDEIAGVGNIMTAQFWEYDSRLGRRWNVDPVKKHWESPYATFANNPIYYRDPEGLDVINGDELRRQDSEKRVVELASKQKSLESLLGTNRKDFKRNGGDDWKKRWKEYKQVKSDLRNERELLSIYTRNSRITAAKIELWKKESPDVFKTVNELKNEYGEKVDFMLGISSTIKDEGAFGKNIIEFSLLHTYNNQTGESVLSHIRPNSPEFGPNKVTIFIHPDTRISEIDPETGGYSLNHEAGHFIWFGGHTSKYYKYIQSLNEASLNGGHNHDDVSGQFALAWERLKN